MKKRLKISFVSIVAIVLLTYHISREDCTAETETFVHSNSSERSNVVSPFASHETIEERDIVVVQFVSSSAVSAYTGNFEQNEEKLLLHLSKAALLLCSPISDVPDVQENIITALHWTHVASYSHIHQYTNGSIEEYLSPRGTRIFFQAMYIQLPRKVLGTHKIEPFCAGRTFSIGYALFSGAVFSHHILQMPIIDKFKVFVKICHIKEI